VVFNSLASDLVARDFNGYQDVFAFVNNSGDGSQSDDSNDEEQGQGQGDNQGDNAQRNNQQDNSALSVEAILAIEQSNASAPSEGLLGGRQALQAALPIPEPAPVVSALPITSVGNNQPMQVDSRPDPVAARAARRRALDQVFADLPGSTLEDALQGDEVPAWAV
jgi:hypothetical protein